MLDKAAAAKSSGLIEEDSAGRAANRKQILRNMDNVAGE